MNHLLGEEINLYVMDPFDTSYIESCSCYPTSATIYLFNWFPPEFSGCDPGFLQSA